MRKFLAAIPLSAALALLACGESDDEPTYIPPPTVLEDPAELFGANLCTCFEYAPESEWAAGESSFTRKLGVSVENLSGATRLGKDYHRVTYRLVGMGSRIVRQEFWDPNDPDLLVAGINPTGLVNDPLVKLDPPASLVRAARVEGGVAPLGGGSLVRSEASMAWVSPGETEEGPDVTVRAQYRALDDVEIGSWDDVERRYLRETVSATPIAYSGVEGLQTGQTRWFVPEVGFVKLQMEFEGDRDDWVLVHTRPLLDCDEAGDSEPTDECGH